MKKSILLLLAISLTLFVMSCSNSPAAVQEKCTVTFDPTDGKDEPWTVEVNKGSKVSKPGNPGTDEDYKVFLYWTQNDKDSFDFNNVQITEDITIKAKWRDKTLGDNGQAGIIFYDIDDDNTKDGGAGADGLRSADAGFRYFEIATSFITTYAGELSGPSFVGPGCYQWSIENPAHNSEWTNTEEGIGKGKGNTEKMAEKLTKGSVAGLVWKEEINGKNDWFIPSLDELKAASRVIKNKIPALNDKAYWSSSYTSEMKAWSCSLDDGETEEAGCFYNDMFVIPVRTF